MKTVSEVSRMSGVSIRTLHHYDAIGLLKPTAITESGYRLYGEEAILRLQTILLFRELRFPLKEIRDILSRPDFDPLNAISRQIELLTMQRDRLTGIISLAKQIQKTGVIPMDFSAFDRTQIDRCTEEAKARWGHTQAWQEFSRKTKDQTPEDMKKSGADLMDVFRHLGEIRRLDPASAEVQAMIERLRAFITEHYYTCTVPILQGLGQMYAAGGEMTDNIDAAGGAGTAAFAHQAIEIYCAKQ